MSQDSRRALWAGVEDIEGQTPSFLRMQPCMDFKSDPKDIRLRLKEYKNSRIRDGKSVRAKKYNEIAAKILARYDLTGWLFTPMLGQPAIAAHTSSTAATSVQVLTFATTTAATIFQIGFDGYLSPQITVGTLAAITASNTELALSRMGSVGNIANVACVGTGTDATAPVVTITFTGSQVLEAVPQMTCTIVSGTGTVAVSSTTAGAGVYDAAYTGGGSGLPTLGFIYFDGTSFKQLLGASVNDLDLDLTTDSFMGADWKLLSRFEVDAPPTYPNYITTTAPETPITGISTITPASMTGIYNGTTLLVVNTNGANPESVVATNVTPTTVDANFALTHAGGGGLVIHPRNYTTTVTAALTSAVAPVTVTPASMQGIVPGVLLTVMNGDGTSKERVLVTAITATTFTAQFQYTHTALWLVLSPRRHQIVAALTNLGSQTITTPSMEYIYVGAMLMCENSAGTYTLATANQEVVTVTAVDYANSTFTAIFSSTKAASWAVVPVNVPTMVESAYNQPVDPTQVTLSLGGAVFSDVKSLKVSLKGNRDALHTIGGGLDMIRATEGEFNVDFEFTARFVGYASSQYKKYIDNTAPGAFVITATDSLTALPGAGNPTMQFTLRAPSYETGVIDSMQPESIQTMKGYAVLDATTATNLSVLLTNQEKRYISLT